jgi:hypothetical protein
VFIPIVSFERILGSFGLLLASIANHMIIPILTASIIAITSQIVQALEELADILFMNQRILNLNISILK